MAVVPVPFSNSYPVVGVVHLAALPGAPGYAGDMGAIRKAARETAAIYERCGIDGIIVENFHDAPFFAASVPSSTVAAMAAITADLVQRSPLPVGVNVLRNDGEAAIAVAAAAGAAFVRINVLGRPVVTEQGIITGSAAAVLRQRAALAPHVALWADAAVKHGSPLVPVPLDTEIYELTERCDADVIIVSGARTGLPTDPVVVKEAVAATPRAVFVGSGVTAKSVAALSAATGFIVGSAFAEEPGGPIEEARVVALMDAVQTLRASAAAHDR